MIKAIIFDFDGILVESTEIKTKSFAKLFKSEGSDVVKKVVDYHLHNQGVSRFDKFRYIYKNILNRKLTKKVFNYLCKKFSNLVINEVIDTPYVKGAKEFIDDNSNKYKLFIISATPEEELKKITARRNLTKYFKEIYGSPCSKEIAVKTIIKNYGLLPKQIVYIGDALSDYKAAYSNSVHFIARIINKENVFKNELSCVKTIKDLSNLNDAIENI